MINQRRLNSSMPKAATPAPIVDKIGRDGRVDKHLVEAQPVVGQVRQTKGDLHPWLHGQAAPLDDEPNLPIKSHEKPIGFSHGVTDKQIIETANNPTAGQILKDAAKLGKA
jgi:hypothetical protein